MKLPHRSLSVFGFQLVELARSNLEQILSCLFLKVRLCYSSCCISCLRDLLFWSLEKFRTLCLPLSINWQTSHSALLSLGCEVVARGADLEYDFISWRFMSSFPQGVRRLYCMTRKSFYFTILLITFLIYPMELMVITCQPHVEGWIKIFVYDLQHRAEYIKPLLSSRTIVFSLLWHKYYE